MTTFFSVRTNIFIGYSSNNNNNNNRKKQQERLLPLHAINGLIHFPFGIRVVTE